MVLTKKFLASRKSLLLFFSDLTVIIITDIDFYRYINVNLLNLNHVFALNLGIFRSSYKF